MEEKKERWLNYCALITVLLALGATLSTLRMGSLHQQVHLEANSGLRPVGILSKQEHQGVLVRVAERQNGTRSQAAR